MYLRIEESGTHSIDTAKPDQIITLRLVKEAN